jgi:small subunit ribosomal protein S17
MSETEFPTVATPDADVPVAPAPAAVSTPAAVSAAVAAPGRSHRKVRVGVVTSAKMQKSIVVSIERLVRHPLYKKYMRKTTTLMAHDEKSEAKLGDTVRVMETRPISSRKRWRLVEIVQRAK